MERKILNFEDVLDFINEEIAMHNVSITDIEKSMGVSTGLISRWKKVKTAPSADKLIDVVNLLDAELIIRSIGNKKEEAKEELLQCEESHDDLLVYLESYFISKLSHTNFSRKFMEDMLTKKFNISHMNETDILCALIFLANIMDIS